MWHYPVRIMGKEYSSDKGLKAHTEYMVPCGQALRRKNQALE